GRLGESESGPVTQEFEYKGRTFEVTCMLIRNEDGEIEGTVSVIRDITDNKKFEARLWQLARRLERKIWEEHMLFELSRLVAMRKSKSNFIREVLDLIYAYFPVLLVFIASMDEKWRVLRIEGVIGAKKEVKDLLLSERGLSRVIDSGEVFYLPDTRGMRSLSRMFGVDALSELILPLKVRGGIEGVLFLGSEKVNAFSEEDRAALKAAADITAIGVENISLYERLEELAITDDLTGLYNRRFFYQRLSEEIARAQRQGTKLVLMILDLDNFKLYNDAFGHLAGDRLLRLFGQLLSRNIRKGMDYAFRYGGDEFIVLLTSVSVEQAVRVAQRVLKEFEMYEFEVVGLSVGIAEYKPGMTEEGLILAADAALYEAKRSGKGKIVVYEESASFSSPSSEASSDASNSSVSPDKS
ncbi:MAG: sensor domain-containing diguanylate cyclase, partial [Synergistetes bacterium]|nr:sensor domain-containing diguanylate cyclase [Synergistota bacterium]